MKLIKKLTNYTTPLSLGVVFSTCMIGCSAFDKSAFDQFGERLLLTQQQTRGVPAYATKVDEHPITTKMIASVKDYMNTINDVKRNYCAYLLLTLLEDLRKGNKVDVNKVYQEVMITDNIGGGITALHIATFILNDMCHNTNRLRDTQIYFTDIRERSEVIIEALLAQGARTEVKDRCAGFTPLMLATHDQISGGTIAKLLLRNGANPNAVDNQQRTVMKLAVYHQNKAVFQVLVQNNVDPVANITPNNHEQMARLAVELGLTHLLEKSIRKVIQPTSEQLATAVKLGHIAVCETLLNAGADANATITPNTTDTVLMQAIKNNNAAIVKLLLEHSADPNKANRYDEFPLALAIKNIKNNNLAIVDLLIQHGAILTSSNAILHAATSNRPDLVQFLINKANVLGLHKKLNYERAFKLALEACDVRTAQLLLQQVVAPVARTVMEFTEESTNKARLSLKDLTPTVTERLLSPYIVEAVNNNDVNKVTILLNLGADPNTVDQNGHTLLQICATMSLMYTINNNPSLIYTLTNIANELVKAGAKNM